MRRYDDPVDVRRGMVDGSEGPEQFLWRGHLWKVHALVGHWLEAGSWWEPPADPGCLGAEHEVWRVAASRGRISTENGVGGVFDLIFDWAEGSWRLTRCLD